MKQRRRTGIAGSRHWEGGSKTKTKNENKCGTVVRRNRALGFYTTILSTVKKNRDLFTLQPMLGASTVRFRGK